MLLKLWRWLNTVIRPMLAVRELGSSEQQTDMDACTMDVVLFLCLFRSQPPVPLFTCQTLHRWNNLWRQEGFYYTRHDTPASACWRSICSQIIAPKSQEKQALISIINQVHTEVFHFFHVDRDKLLVVVVAEIQFKLVCYSAFIILYYFFNDYFKVCWMIK